MTRSYRSGRGLRIGSDRGGLIEDGASRSAENQSVDRLHCPGVGLGPAGQEVVGVAVQEHDDPLRADASGTFLQPEVQAGGHATHVPDLQVEDDQYRFVGGHGFQNLGPSVNPHHRVVSAQGSLHLVVDVVGIGGHQYGRLAHGGDRTDVAVSDLRSGRQQDGGR